MKNRFKAKAALGAGALALGVIMPFLAYAEGHIEEDNQILRVRDEIRDTREELRVEFEGVRTEIRDKEVMFREETEEKREELRMELKGTTDSVEKMEKMEAFRTDVMKAREDLRTDILQKRTDFRVDSRERIDALKEHVGEARAGRIENFFMKMMERFEAAIDRLHALATRIEERLNFFESLGKDVTEFRLMLGAAFEKLAMAEDELLLAKAEFEEMTLSDNPREAFGQVKVLVSKVKEVVREAHAALVDVINSIKGASGRLVDSSDSDENATSTDESN